MEFQDSLRVIAEMQTRRRTCTVTECIDQQYPIGPRRRRLATIVVERPRCPRCNGIDLRKYRSVRDQGDGSALWWVRCGADGCGYRFRVLLE